jgi:ribosomal protein S18 acetylase RimI-like enzyme
MNGRGHMEFREIDLTRHTEEAVRFRADSFECSFGSPERFYEEAGPGCQRYLDGLAAKNRDLPGSCVHVWLGDRIVGQVELRRDLADARRAHVLLYYIIPELRGRGLGEHLDTYVGSFLWRAGVVSAWLRVSPANARAMRFYEKHAWIDRGPDEQHPDVHVMEKDLLASSPPRAVPDPPFTRL